MVPTKIQNKCKEKQIKAYRYGKSPTPKGRQPERQKTKELQNSKKTIKMAIVGLYQSITTLNINGLNVPIKRHRVVEWIKKQKNQLYASYNRLTSASKTHIDSK